MYAFAFSEVRSGGRDASDTVPRVISSANQAGQRLRGVARLLFGRNETSLKSHFARGTTGTFGLKVTTSGLAFLISLLLARLLGVTGYGAYAYALAWVRFLVVPALLGLDKLLIREIAACHTQSAWGLMRGLLRRTNQAVLGASVGFGMLGAAVGLALAGHLGSQMVTTLWVALIMVPLLAFTRIKQATLQGLQKVVRGQVPELLIQPLLFIILVGSAYLVLGKGLGPPSVAGMYVGAAGVALLVGARLLSQALPTAVRKASPTYQMRAWVRSAMPLLFVGGMYIINSRISIIMLGSLKGAEAAGIYTVADQGAALITYVLFAVSAPLAPTVASLYALGDMERLQRVITKSVRVILLFALPIAFVLIVFGYWFLLLFGHDFTRGQTALIFLSVAQLMTAIVGPVSLLLIMTGHERDAAKGIGICALLNVILNALLIPLWGLNGAAIATTSSTITWNLLLAIWVYRRLGIYPTALGRIRLRRKTIQRP